MKSYSHIMVFQWREELICEGIVEELEVYILVPLWVSKLSHVYVL